MLKFTAAYGTWAVNKTGIKENCARARCAHIRQYGKQPGYIGTLQGLGIDVVDLGLSTTPTVEVAVPDEKAAGGIILTASHNPKQWNALKLLNADGEFINDADGKEVLEIAENSDFKFADVNDLGSVNSDNNYLQAHIDKILALPLVDVAGYKKRRILIL